MCVCPCECETCREGEDLLFYLILHIQGAFLLMEESQGLHVAVSRRVVDSVGSALRVGERTALQDLSLTFSKSLQPHDRNASLENTAPCSLTRDRSEDVLGCWAQTQS